MPRKNGLRDKSQLRGKPWMEESALRQVFGVLADPGVLWLVKKRNIGIGG